MYKNHLIITVMKRLICFTVFFALIAGNSFAQTKPFRFGVRLSPNVSWMKPLSDTYENGDAAIGISWGFISDFTLTDNYFISTGFDIVYNYGNLEYPYKSTQYDTTGMMYRKYHLRYVRVPAMLKMRTNRFDRFSFLGQLGLGAGFRIGAKAKDRFEYFDTTGQKITAGTEEKNISGDTKLFMASLIIGFGAEYFIDESTSIIACINYNNGFSNVLNGTNTADASIKEKAQLHYFELVLGVIF